MEEINECVKCGRELKGKHTQIGIIAETGKYTLDDEKATQGFFPIGIHCFKKVKKELT